MGKTYQAWDVDQEWLLPSSVHDFVAQDHPAHLVREIVRVEPDLSAILAPYERELRGYPPDHPAMMVALLLYADSRGICSSQVIARGCEERLDFSADAGFCNEDNLAALEARSIAGHLMPGRARHNRAGDTGARRIAPGSRMARMQAKLRRAGRRSRYRLRKQIVEPVFGQIKAARSFRQFLLRGFQNVRLEWALICTVHNLAKLLTNHAA